MYSRSAPSLDSTSLGITVERGAEKGWMENVSLPRRSLSALFSAMRSSLDTPRAAAHEHEPLIPLRTTEEGEFVVNEPILNPNPFPTLCPSCLGYFFMENHE